MDSDSEGLPDVSGASDGEFPSGPPDEHPLKPGDRIDDFEILEEVGRGGMGIVYKAMDHSLKRVVALKVLHPHIAGNASAAKRFRREAVLAANLSHPNIVPVHRIDDRPLPRYFTMEFIDGKSLKDKIEAEGFLAPDEVIRIGLQICEALGYAHEHNIIHRDIKPSNILLENHLERVRVTDFGIARDMTGELGDMTLTGVESLGTPAFMSPEQNLGRDLDARTDIFSLGMTLYYCLTGKTAYKASNRQELAVAFEQKKPTRPSRCNPSVTRDMDRVIGKLISVDPSSRYQDATAAAAALKSISLPSEGSAGTVDHGNPRSRLVIATVLFLAFLGLAIWLHRSPGDPVTSHGSQEPSTSQLPNVALTSRGASASAISTGSYLGNTMWPKHAIDGDPETGWASQWSIPAWLQVEFDKVYVIQEVGVRWGPHNHRFSISLSEDGETWTEVVKDRVSSQKSHHDKDGLAIGGEFNHERFAIKPTRARAIRIDLSTTSAPRGHIFQAIVHELEAYAITEGASPLPDNAVPRSATSESAPSSASSAGEARHSVIPFSRLPGRGQYGIRWSKVADLPSDQFGGEAAVLDGKVYLLGGSNAGGNYYAAQKTVRILDPATGPWRNGPSMLTTRYNLGAAVLRGANGEDKLYAIGGANPRGVSSVERYSSSSERWQPVTPLPQMRGHGIMVAVVNNRLYAIGGGGDQRDFYATNEMLVPGADGKGVWEAKAPITVDGTVAPMSGGLVCVQGDKIYIFGGEALDRVIRTTLIYDTATNTWSRGADIPTMRKYHGGAVVAGDHILLLGGTEERNKGIIDVYDPQADKWLEKQTWPGGNGLAPNITQDGSLIYVIGDQCNTTARLEAWVGVVGKAGLRVPEGFKAKAGTVAEPYTKTGWAKEVAHEKTGMELVFIPAGEFQMGSPAEEKDRSDHEGPIHRVRITRPFYMGKHEVTQGEWQKVMGENPSHFKGEHLPVESVFWDDCQGFLGQAGDGLRLPTEAEWEYACRAGTKTAFSTGETISTAEANYDGSTIYGNGRKGECRQKPVSVGSFEANGWGLHDMHGNVWEWCSDWYGSDYYGKSENVDPTGPTTGRTRVIRGGSYADAPKYCRSAYRLKDNPDYRDSYFGLRVVVPVDQGAFLRGSSPSAPDKPVIQGRPADAKRVEPGVVATVEVVSRSAPLLDDGRSEELAAPIMCDLTAAAADSPANFASAFLEVPVVVDQFGVAGPNAGTVRENALTLLASSPSQFNQSPDRSLMLFLHKKGLLKTFINKVRLEADDPTGLKTLEAVCGEPVGSFEKKWKEWIRAQPVDDNVLLVERAFVKTKDEWDTWWATEKDRLTWDEQQGIYRVKAANKSP